MQNGDKVCIQNFKGIKYYVQSIAEFQNNQNFSSYPNVDFTIAAFIAHSNINNNAN